MNLLLFLIFVFYCFFSFVLFIFKKINKLFDRFNPFRDKMPFILKMLLLLICLYKSDYILIIIRELITCIKQLVLIVNSEPSKPFDLTKNVIEDDVILETFFSQCKEVDKLDRLVKLDAAHERPYSNISLMLKLLLRDYFYYKSRVEAQVEIVFD
jgi:hypothetical protein